ncbi:MAG: GIY-YIG nuclease family protein [Chlamydiae bacterium]|nr:GIY-YIG nuclease family protein [Chlamydiota bacterium]MBI3267098.1 GIY-YIG nuclease family protein [Chlamydiota bacterium]
MRDFALTKTYYVYLMTHWNHRVIYVGVTNDLQRRVYEHKNKLVEGFTTKYNKTTNPQWMDLSQSF